MKLISLSILLLSSPAAFADPACGAFPKCGEYSCASYLEGLWKDAAGQDVKGAFITTEDFKKFQLVQTDDGTASGNVTKVLAECSR